jgi:hypothetical protein
MSALIAAVRDGVLEIVKRLVADVKEKDVNGFTPLL